MTTRPGDLVTHLDATVAVGSPNVDDGMWYVIHRWHMATAYPFSMVGDGDDASSFWRALIMHADKCGGCTVYGWHMWRAWCVLNGMQELREDRLSLKIQGENPPGLFVAADPPTIIRVLTAAGRSITFVDIANWGVTEEAVADVEGIPDGGIHQAWLAVTDYRRMIDHYGMGPERQTAASQAWSCYQQSHSHLHIPSDRGPVTDMEQSAYFGGRCEVLRMGPRKGQKIYHVDINSMYTTLGREALFPTRLSHAMDGIDQPIDASCLTTSYLPIADVTLQTDCPYYPASDRVRVRPDGVPQCSDGRERVIFPIGRFRAVLCGPELAMAVSMGHVVAWHRLQQYRADRLMDSWSHWALAMRASLWLHDLRHMAQSAKKIVNSLPGKWGQRQKRWVDVASPYDAGHVRESDVWMAEWGRHPVTGAMTEYRTIAGQTQYLDEADLAPHACPSVAAYWTSYGRVQLLGLILLVGRDHVYYYDTDSLHVDQHGYNVLSRAGVINPDVPGRMKLVEESDDVEYYGIRRYRFGKRWCIAGPGAKVIGRDDDLSMPSGEWIGDEGFGRQMWDRTVGRPLITRGTVSPRNDYHHGVVCPDGVVSPYVVGGDNVSTTGDHHV